MTGYLARLVDRASGPLAGAIAPRLGPVFPLTPATDDDWETAVSSGSDERAAAARTGRGTKATGGSSPEATTDGAAGELPVAAPPVERGEGPGRRDSPAAPPKPPGGRISAPVPAPVLRSPGSDTRGITGAASVAPAPLPAGTPGARTGSPPLFGPAVPPRVAARDTTGRPPRGKAVARIAAARPVAVALPRARAAGAPAHEASRIEVRIGRVEIRRPAPPDPFEWPLAPAADGRSHGGFDDLAATRRYIDRRWS